MKFRMTFVLALCIGVHAQEPQQPKMDSVTVTWNEDALTGHTATLKWSEQTPEPPGIQVNRYRIYRGRTENGIFNLKSSTSHGAKSYIDKTVVSGKTYWYYVTALSTTGIESSPSNTVAVTIP